MAKLNLWFSSFERCILERTLFFHPLLQVEQRAVRGKTWGAFPGYNCFQWTPALQAMAILILRTLHTSSTDNRENAKIKGAASSPASSLDYSISKGPNWILDVFGVDKNGFPMARRLFRRTNTERKRGGDVTISLNESILKASDISVYLDDSKVNDPMLLEHLLHNIERYWLPHKNGAQVSSQQKYRNHQVWQMAKSHHFSDVKESHICAHCGSHIANEGK